MFKFLFKSKEELKKSPDELNEERLKLIAKKRVSDLNGKYLNGFPYNGRLCLAGASRYYNEIKGKIIRSDEKINPADILATFNPYPKKTSEKNDNLEEEKEKQEQKNAININNNLSNLKQ